MKLLPCPFCGCRMSGRTEYKIIDDAYENFLFAVSCPNCSARGPFSDLDDGTSEARAKTAARKLWNERCST